VTRGIRPATSADTHFDVRLQDIPPTNRRPDVAAYRADVPFPVGIDLTTV
jgi:hypothetical protein